MSDIEPSAISIILSNTTTKSPRESLALEILHNLQHQHRWTDLKLFTVSSPPSEPSTPTTSPTRSRGRSKSPGRNTVFLISGLPPRHSYIHPDLQKWLIKNDVDETDIAIQREWVLPLSLGEKWSLKQFCWVFDGLAERELVKVESEANDPGEAKTFEWKDSKRMILAMLAHNGFGGDGTVTYYIMQEGEVKPRQHG